MTYGRRSCFRLIPQPNNFLPSPFRDSDGSAEGVMEKKTSAFTVRIEPERKLQLEALAVRLRRSVGDTVRMLVEDAVVDQDKQGATLHSHKRIA